MEKVETQALLHEISWLQKNLQSNTYLRNYEATKPKITFMTEEGQRYINLVKQLQRVGKQISKKDMENVSLAPDNWLFLAHPQFVLDACILHHKTDNSLSLEICHAFQQFVQNL